MAKRKKSIYKKPVLKSEGLFEKNVLACNQNGVHCTYKQQGKKPQPCK